jgi:hypothetical protein
MALSLKIDLEARFAQALDSFDKLEKQAGKSLKRVESAAQSVNTTLAAIGVGLSVAAVTRSFQAAVDEIAALDDAAEASGASVEALSSLLNTLAPTGVGLEQITDITGKLTKSMVDAGDKTSRAGAAFRAIGIETRDASGNLRNVDDVLGEIATALLRYEDGANKTAIAQALLGKSGADYLPVLKDLATRQRESATVTKEQAAAAETLKNNIRELQRQLSILSQDLVVRVVPSLNEFFIKLRSIAAISSSPVKWVEYLFGDAADIDVKVTEVQTEIDRLNRIISGELVPSQGANQRDKPGGTGLLGQALERFAGTEQQQAAARKRVLELARDLQELKAVQAAQRKLRAESNGPPLTTAPITDTKDEKPRNTERLGEADKVLRKTIEQLLATEKLTEVGRLELQEALAGYPQKVAGAEQIAKGLAKQIDLITELRDSERLAQQQREQAARVALANIAAVDRAESEADEAIKRDIEAIKDAVDPTRALYREIERVRDLVSAGLPLEFGNARLAQLYSEVDRILLAIPEVATEAQGAVTGLLAPIESAFETMILQGGKARDILTSLASDIAQFIIRSQITGPLFEILGGTASSSKTIGKTLVGQLFGFGGSFATGGDPPVGRWSLVGEKGPELIKPLSPMRVYPNGYGPAGGGGGVNVTQNINVGSGVNRTEVAQAMYAAKEAAKAEILASMRRGSTFAAA